MRHKCEDVMRVIASAAISRLSASISQQPLPQEVRASLEPSCANCCAACPLSQKVSASSAAAASAVNNALRLSGANRLSTASTNSGANSHSAGPCSREIREMLLPDSRRLGA
ncbi:hypothetical protein D3C71_1386830 [compost metagenome]